MIAMSQKERVKVQLKNFFKHFRKSSIVDETKNDAPDASEKGASEDLEGNHTPQYRLEASNRKRRGWFCCSGAANAKELSDIKPNERLASSLHWMFRSNFVVLFSVMCLCFFGLIILFAGFIMAAGKLNPECVRVGKKEKLDKKVSFFEYFN